MTTGAAIVTGHKNFKNLAGTGPEEGTLNTYDHVYVLSKENFGSVKESTQRYSNCTTWETFESAQAQFRKVSSESVVKHAGGIFVTGGKLLYEKMWREKRLEFCFVTHIETEFDCDLDVDLHLLTQNYEMVSDIDELSSDDEAVARRLEIFKEFARGNPYVESGMTYNFCAYRRNP